MESTIAEFDVVSKAESGIEVPLRSLRTGEPTGIVFIVHGPDSKAYRRAMAESRREFAQAMEDGTVDLTDPDATVPGACKVLAACTVGWRNLKDANGEVIEFSPAKAVEIYTKYPPIREQIDRVIGDRKAFIAG